MQQQAFPSLPPFDPFQFCCLFLPSCLSQVPSFLPSFMQSAPFPLNTPQAERRARISRIGGLGQQLRHTMQDLMRVNRLLVNLKKYTHDAGPLDLTIAPSLSLLVRCLNCCNSGETGANSTYLYLNSLEGMLIFSQFSHY